MADTSLALMPFQVFANGIQSQINQKNQRALMFEQNAMNRENMALSQAYSVNNALNASRYERISKEKAGLNLNAESGYSPLAGASAPSVNAPQVPEFRFPDMASFMSQLSQTDLNQSQAEKNREEARGLKISNDARERANNLLKTLSPRLEIFHEKNGKVAVQFEVGSEEELQAYKNLMHTKSELSGFDADDIDNKLRKAISDGQLSDSEIVQSIIKRPAVETSKLFKEVIKIGRECSVLTNQGNLIKEQIETEKVNRKLAENKDIMTNLQKIFGDSDLGPLDRFLSILTIAIACR